MVGLNCYSPRSRTLSEGDCSRSKRATSGYKGAPSGYKGEIGITLKGGKVKKMNNEGNEETKIKIPKEILKQCINLVNSIRELINQNDKKPRFYTHKTNKKYYEKHNIKTSTDFSIYILNLCKEYLEKIDTKDTYFINNNLQTIKKINSELSVYKSNIRNLKATDEDTEIILSEIFLQINNLLEIGK